MRCPKCHYLSFEPEPRCRNCGYDLSFEPDDLLFTNAARHDEPLVDLDLPVRDIHADSRRTSTDAIDLGSIPDTAEPAIDPTIELQSISQPDRPDPPTARDLDFPQSPE